MDELCEMEVSAGVARLTLCSRANANALSPRLASELAGHLTRAEEDRTVRTVVLAADGTSFCAGVDLKSGGPIGAIDLPALLSRILELPKPVVAEVDGAVRGAGIGLVAASDVAIASDKAHFAFSEVRVGVAPAIIAVVCARRMTPRALSRFMLTGEVFSAGEARDAGLVTIAAGTELTGRVASVLEAFALAEPGAVATTKRLLRTLPSMGDAAFDYTALLSAEMFSSSTAAEGMQAFAEKRRPSWVS